jgi:polygalacturonase
MPISRLAKGLFALLLLTTCRPHRLSQVAFDQKTALAQEQAGWAALPKLLARIRPPKFPDRDFPIASYGAVGNGQADNRAAFAQAIAACHAAGGGRVVVPPGDYLVNGPIGLRSRVNLHLQKGATVRFGTDPAHYLPVVKVRWEGTVCYNYSPLVYAYQQQDIAITGQGTLDGQTEGTWSRWKKDNDGQNQEVTKKIIRQMGQDGVPEAQRVFGQGHYLRPTLVEFYECQNILLEGFTAKSSPFWTIHPVFCRNLTVRGLTIRPGTTNDDGIDPDSCTDVLIEHCDIETDDDPISLKAGRDQDAWNRPGTRGVVVRHCKLSSKVGNAFCIGSEMSGGVEQVYIEDCHSPTAPNGLNFKCNLDRGGRIRQVYARNLTFGHCQNHGLLFQMDYHGYRGGNFPPDFQEFYLANLRFGQVGKVGVKIVGVAAQPIRRVLLRQVTVAQVPQPTEVKYANQVVTVE